MKIGILVSSIGGFGNLGFYNLQELGLGKALARFAERVLVYRLVAANEVGKTQPIEGVPNATFTLLPAKQIGANGLVDTHQLDETMDILLYFSDNQLSVPEVYRWARRHRIRFYPYIGVLESHSLSPIKRCFMDLLMRRDYAVYRRCHCFAKTPDIEKQLREHGVKQVTVLPVGLDAALLHQEFEQVSPRTLREKYGFMPDDRILLFIGRLTEEKRPLEMIDLFARVYEKHPEFKLLIIGKGEMASAVSDRIRTAGLENAVKRLERLPNTQIWEVYRMAEAFINLNRQEIFGMAILEAMYYGCKVIAVEAPGPCAILEHGKTGYLARSSEEIEALILSSASLEQAARQSVLERFLWDRSAETLYQVLTAEK